MGTHQTVLFMTFLLELVNRILAKAIHPFTGPRKKPPPKSCVLSRMDKRYFSSKKARNPHNPWLTATHVAQPTPNSGNPCPPIYWFAVYASGECSRGSPQIAGIVLFSICFQFGLSSLSQLRGSPQIALRSPALFCFQFGLSSLLFSRSCSRRATGRLRYAVHG